MQGRSLTPCGCGVPEVEAGARFQRQRVSRSVRLLPHQSHLQMAAAVVGQSLRLRSFQHSVTFDPASSRLSDPVPPRRRNGVAQPRRAGTCPPIPASCLVSVNARGSILTPPSTFAFLVYPPHVRCRGCLERRCRGSLERRCCWTFLVGLTLSLQLPVGQVACMLAPIEVTNQKQKVSSVL